MGSIEEPQNSLPVLYTRQKNHESHIVGHQVQVAFGQLKAHILQTKA